MNNPRDARYTENEWVRIAGDVAVIGINDLAQSQLGNVIQVELPLVNLVLAQGKPVGRLESAKGVFDFHAPLSGAVIERNEKLFDEPLPINQDCYGAGWLIKVRPSNAAELDSLMTAEQYDSYERNG